MVQQHSYTVPCDMMTGLGNIWDSIYETIINMEERDTEWGNSQQKKDSDQPRQNKGLVPKKGGYFCGMDVVGKCV